MKQNQRDAVTADQLHAGGGNPNREWLPPIREGFIRYRDLTTDKVHEIDVRDISEHVDTIRLKALVAAVRKHSRWVWGKGPVGEEVQDPDEELYATMEKILNG